MKKLVGIVSGPTATGKTSTSIALAKSFNAEVVNFDSLVFYKEISIGTAKPTIEEQDGVPHHLVGSESIQSPINAAQFQEKAIPIINEIHARNKNVILVGGSGFYLQTLLNGMYKGGTTPTAIIEKSDKLYSETGIKEFLNILKECDLASFERYHENDHYRIRRAVEFFWHTGKAFSEQRKNMQSYLPESPAKQNNWNCCHIHLDLPKDEHFKIIQKRTNEMINAGLVEEVKDLLASGFSCQLKPLQSIGYKETVAFLEGQFSNLDEYKERISISTRQLAKSQRTWFSKVDKTSFNPLLEQENIFSFFKDFSDSLS